MNNYSLFVIIYINCKVDDGGKMKKVGFTIGKFAPFHKGHQFLLETALNEMEEVYAIIYDTDVIDVTVEERSKWIKELYPNVNIIYAFNSPKQYGLDEESVKIQMDYLSNLVKDIPVTHFYSSEPYGEKVAEYLKIENRIVDKERINVPISARIIRRDYYENRKYLENVVFEDIKKHKSIDKKTNYLYNV